MFYTIKEDEVCALWSRDGKCTIIQGPKRMFLWSSKLEILGQYRADEKQYLKIRFQDGHVEHRRGPINVHFHPLLHSEITVENALSLTSHEILVIYRPVENRVQRFHLAKNPEGEGDGENSSLLRNSSDASFYQRPLSDSQGYTTEVQRIVIQGPIMHIPEPNEWTHEFVWHGTDPTNKTRKIPGALKFTKLRVIPDQFYYNIPDVRTNDDALITVKCMIFFELVDIERMLDSTHDPVADFINSICADVIAFSASRTYEKFLEQTALLNSLESYPQLAQRAERMGYHISKVVYRGYHASDKLQRMHDDAIEARTALRLESDTHAQRQELEDNKLAKEFERSSKRREMESAEKQHQQELERMSHELELQRMKSMKDLELSSEKAQNEEKLRFLDHLKTTGVDLTKYLVAQYQNPDKVIKILDK